jgi:mannose-P-dolichol utilization defect protein 1
MEQLQKFILDPVKPVIVPITTNLPAPIRDAAISLLGDPCYSALLLDVDFAQHPECVSLAISKVLGIAIITAASVVKVPQIIKLARSQSAEGLSFPSYLLETASFVITLAYNVRSGFPFSTYGEVGLILVQDVIITVLILWYTGRVSVAGAVLAALGASAYAMMGNNELVDDGQMKQLQTVAGVLGVASKLPQILANYQQGGTGQLSAFAVFNYLAGSLSRIFTTLQEVDDQLILWGFIAGFSLNAILAFQMVYYWDSPTTAGHGNEIDTVHEKKGLLQTGVAGTATDEYIAAKPGAASSPRPTSSSGRRRA